jgi:hypothetical protein
MAGTARHTINVRHNIRFTDTSYKTLDTFDGHGNVPGAYLAPCFLSLVPDQDEDAVYCQSGPVCFTSFTTRLSIDYQLCLVSCQANVQYQNFVHYWKESDAPRPTDGFMRDSAVHLLVASIHLRETAMRVSPDRQPLTMPVGDRGRKVKTAYWLFLLKITGLSRR